MKCIQSKAAAIVFFFCIVVVQNARASQQSFIFFDNRDLKKTLQWSMPELESDLWNLEAYKFSFTTEQVIGGEKKVQKVSCESPTLHLPEFRLPSPDQKVQKSFELDCEEYALLLTLSQHPTSRSGHQKQVKLEIMNGEYEPMVTLSTSGMMKDDFMLKKIGSQYWWIFFHK
ncbi:MAG: hypothetical protein KDD52_01070 [Bdellovibrionales bacterium]|nr:hypothetical protein [Bdellovibrionales bacterium]